MQLPGSILKKEAYASPFPVPLPSSWDRAVMAGARAAIVGMKWLWAWRLHKAERQDVRASLRLGPPALVHIPRAFMVNKETSILLQAIRGSALGAMMSMTRVT